MRRSMMALAAAAALTGAVFATPEPASAAGTVVAPIVAAPRSLHPVQFYGAGPSHGAGPYWGDDGWERRRRWREWRERQDETRILEAARREAWRIEQEREQRRAWWRAQREQYGYGPAYGYGQQRAW